MSKKSEEKSKILKISKEEYLRKKGVLTSFFSDKSYVLMTKKQIAHVFNIKKEEYEILDKILNELEEECKIIVDSSKRYVPINSSEYVICIYEAKSEKFGFGITENGEDIYISTHVSNCAMNNDKILVRVHKTPFGLEGEVIKIIKRGTKTVIGRYQKLNNFGFVEPIDRKTLDIYIPNKYTAKIPNNQMVEVEILKYPTSTTKAEGKIIDIIGNLKETNIEIKALYKSYELDKKETFSKAVIDEVKKIPIMVTDLEKSLRVDKTNEMIVTIDGEDAKDLDDAVSVKKLNDGNYLLSVYIADVSYYVKDKTPLDKEAASRGTSTYIPGTVIPMLPKELSNGICSLNENVDRLTLAIDMKINKKGEVVDSHIYKAVIKVSKRMTYDKVYNVLNGIEEKGYKKYTAMLYDMKELALILNKKRRENGSINFDIKETKVILDKKGEVIAIKPYEITIANNIIEEFMLIANMTVAEKFFYLDAPFIYRIHERPDEEKLRELNEILSGYNKVIKGIKNVHPKTLSNILDSITEEEEKQVVSNYMLRTLKLAKYSEECSGHFGLSAKFYTHFTSPIRRYPDLFIHRVISDYIDNGYVLTEAKINKYKKQAKLYAKISSDMEKQATLIERDFDNLYMSLYMSRFIGNKYNAIVSQITSFGMFVKLSNTVQGFVPFSEIPYNDYFFFDERTRHLIGENTKEIFKVGDKLVVKLIKSDIRSRQIDFSIVKRGFDDEIKN